MIMICDWKLCPDSLSTRFKQAAVCISAAKSCLSQPCAASHTLLLVFSPSGGEQPWMISCNSPARWEPETAKSTSETCPCTAGGFVPVAETSPSSSPFLGQDTLTANIEPKKHLHNAGTVQTIHPSFGNVAAQAASHLLGGKGRMEPSFMSQKDKPCQSLPAWHCRKN